MSIEKKVLLRFDDICPTMNWEQWGRAKQLMDEVGVIALLGVIPDCQDPDLLIDKPRADFWEYLKSLQRQGYTIAMHGYHHVFDIQASGLSTPRKQSEFAGLPFEVQYKKIYEGKKLLKEHGIETDIFFAPAHSYDENTLKALAANGFRYLSDGKSSHAYVWHGIKLLPCRASGAAKIGKEGYFTSVFHAHEWSRPEKRYDMESFIYTINNYSSNIVNFSEYSQQPIYNKTIMQLNERVYMFWEHYLKSTLRKVYKKIK